MPGRRAKARAFGPWADPDFVPPPPPKSKKHRRARHKKRFHHAFRVLIALGLIPTKSRQCDPLGLRLNRMHVMDTDCEKIGGGCLAAESAPELAKPSSSPTLVNDAKPATAHMIKQVDDEKTALLNGGSNHSTDTTTETTSHTEDEVTETSAPTECSMEVEDVKGTKDNIIDDEEELLGDDEELTDVGQIEMSEDKEAGLEEDDTGNVIREPGEAEEEEEDEDEDVTITKSEVENSSKNIAEDTKETSSPEVVPMQKSESVEELKEVPSDLKLNNVKPDSKPSSPPTVPTQIKTTKEGSVVTPVIEREEKSAMGFSNKHSSLREIEKRKITNDREVEGEVSSGSESDTGRKKIKLEPDLETTTNNEPRPSRAPDHPIQHLVDDDREHFIQEFISQCSQSVEDMDRAAERLHKEVETLAELARAKELEWNAVLRVRKMREEMLERLLRKRRLATDEYIERTHIENALQKNVNKYQGNNQLMMVPIVSSSPSTVMGHRGPPPVRLPPEYGKQQRPILPKPYANLVDTNCPQGRNGPIVDVKSIIADYSSGYRSRHPENVPRRGRRIRTGGYIEPPPNRMSANPSLISMANMALGSGASIRTVSESPHNLSQDHSRPSSTDTRGGMPDGMGNMGYIDVLERFAKLTNQSVSASHAGKGPPNGLAPPPPPPYPEVTLHPVSRPGSSPPTPPTSSLLHGILTKSSGVTGSAVAAAAASRPPANFSPTLARLLTAPDRPPHPVQQPPHFRPQHPPRVSIADILSSSKKSRNEITITPVSGNPSAKPKEDVVLLQDDDETEVSDRLVIDESADNEEVPQCQGCRQKPAQFVCAGCGNQWYCSRECQVTAWEEHSDVCSG